MRCFGRGVTKAGQCRLPIQRIFPAGAATQIALFPTGRLIEMACDWKQSSTFEQSRKFVCQDAERNPVSHRMVKHEPEEMLICGEHVHEACAPKRWTLHDERQGLTLADVGQCCRQFMLCGDLKITGELR